MQVTDGAPLLGERGRRRFRLSSGRLAEGLVETEWKRWGRMLGETIGVEIGVETAAP